MNRRKIVAPTEIEAEGARLLEEWYNTDTDISFEEFRNARCSKASLKFLEEISEIQEEAKRNNVRI